MVESASGILSEPLEQRARRREGARSDGAAGVHLSREHHPHPRPRDPVLPRDRPRSPPPAECPSLPASPAEQQLGLPIWGSPLPGPDAIVLNDWAARELAAAVGDSATIEYYLWDAAAGLRTANATFTVAARPDPGLAADRQLAPEYPGITGAESLADWDPPFPLDLSRVRPQDEQYWDDHRTTPKAFIAVRAGARAVGDAVRRRSPAFAFRLSPAQDAAALRGRRCEPAAARSSRRSRRV